MNATGRARAVVATAIAGTAFIAVLAFWLSFTALTHLAIRADIAEKQAWAWPLIVDGVIVVATVAVVALRGRAGSRYAWALLAAGASVSVTANAIQAAWPVTKPIPPGLAAAICSVPPIVLLAITHLTVVLARGQKAKDAAATITPIADLLQAQVAPAPNFDAAAWRNPATIQPASNQGVAAMAAQPEEPMLVPARKISRPALAAQVAARRSAETVPELKPVVAESVATVPAAELVEPRTDCPNVLDAEPDASSQQSSADVDSRAANIAEAERLVADGWSFRQIGKQLGVADTTVARWLKEKESSDEPVD